MKPQQPEAGEGNLLDRLRKSWFPAAAVVGALASFIAAALRLRPEPGTVLQTTEKPAPPVPPQQAGPNLPAGGFKREYRKSGSLVGGAAAQQFRSSLAGIAVGPGDRVYALGDGEIRTFEPGGSLVAVWKVVPNASCLAAGSDGHVCIGAPGRVEIYDPAGRHTGGFAAGESAGRPAGITAVKWFRDEILAADADARLIRRYDRHGKQLGLIGTKARAGSFILPNGWLDFDVDAQGVIHATDTGRHQVTAWALDGTPLGSFGKFGMGNPEDFVGCCNPVNVAVTHDGKIVTGEKMVARVKVYEPDGRLLALIGPENFDPKCIHLHLAVDSKGWILVADPVRREVSRFFPVAEAADNAPLRDRETAGGIRQEYARI